jgi:hypothetical protein
MVVERPGTDPTTEAGSRFVLTDLRDGRRSEVVAPTPPEQSLSTGRLFDASPLTALSAPRDGPPVLAMTSGRAVLRLRGTPLPAPSEGPGQRVLDESGRYLVDQTATGFTVRDRGGAELGRLDRPVSAATAHWSVGADLWVVDRPAPDGDYRAERFALPGLTRTASVPVPAVTPVPGLIGGTSVPDVAVLADGTVVTVGEGELTAVEAATGRVLGRIAVPDAVGSPRRTLLWERPAQPGQVAFLTPSGELQLWEAATGRTAGSVDLGPIAATVFDDQVLAFDDAGTRVAALYKGEAVVRVWDVAGGGQLGAPIPVDPVTDAVAGFTGDGYLVVAVRGVGSGRFDFLDPATGRQGGSLPFREALAEVDLHRDALTVSGDPQRLPQRIPVAARAWFDAICAVADRPFTPSERAVLPAGVTGDPPCRD